MPEDVKELRVKIDMSYHLKLHALKLLRNKKMSEAVEEALNLYFDEVVGLDAAGGIPASARAEAKRAAPAGAGGSDEDDAKGP